MKINLKRAYDKAEKSDGYRILVDRLWPRGISKEQAQIDQWLKEISPSNELRKAYKNGNLDWEEFKANYFKELESHQEELQKLARQAEKEQITFVYSAKNTEQNNAVALKEYLEKMNAG